MDLSYTITSVIMDFSFALSMIYCIWNCLDFNVVELDVLLWAFTKIKLSRYGKIRLAEQTEGLLNWFSGEDKMCLGLYAERNTLCWRENFKFKQDGYLLHSCYVKCWIFHIYKSYIRTNKKENHVHYYQGKKNSHALVF